MSILNTTLTSTPSQILGTVGERAITVVYLHNLDSSAVSINLYAVPSGQTPDNTNIFYGGVVIEPSDTFIIDTEKMLLANGDTVYASATVDNVVVATVSYTTI